MAARTATPEAPSEDDGEDVDIDAFFPPSSDEEEADAAEEGEDDAGGSAEVREDGHCVQTTTVAVPAASCKAAAAGDKILGEARRTPFQAKWQVAVYPKGNDEFHKHLSVFVEMCNLHELAPGWSLGAMITVAVLHPTKRQNNVQITCFHEFNAEEFDWGFNTLMRLDQVPRYLHDGALKVSVTMDFTPKAAPVQPTPRSLENDSRKATGYVGLENQGATCYMNSLLQTLYHTPAFRMAVYQMPTSSQDDPNSNIQLALQRVFFNLKYSRKMVQTRELTKSFGWDTMDSFTQHDVQELDRILCDKLEEKMKGTPAEGTISRLFAGKIRSFVKCVTVPYESSREETFYDLSLTVKGCPNIVSSFKNYTETELLDGPNKYDAEGYGLQVARKGSIFTSFPPILHIQLRRFAFDAVNGMLAKINDKFEFTPELDLTPFLQQQQEGTNGDAAPPPVYQLHAVLVHAGSVYGGHYYSFIRPTLKNKWFRMDDDVVKAAKLREVFDENFGGAVAQHTSSFFGSIQSMMRACASAYMLVYFRKSDINTILYRVSSSVIPRHLKLRYAREQKAEQRRAELIREAKEYVTIKVATEAELLEHTKSDLVGFNDEVKLVFKEKLATPFSAVKEKIVTQLRLPSFRLWKCDKRKNQTIRPDRILPEQETRTVEQLADSNMLYLLIETDDKCDPSLAHSSVLFLKYFDILLQRPMYKGKIQVNDNACLQDLFQEMRRRANLSPCEPLLIFEDVRATMTSELRPENTLYEAKLSTGDVVVYQQCPPQSSPLPPSAFLLAKDYFSYLANRTTVRFIPLHAETQQAMPPAEAATACGTALPPPTTVFLEMSREWPYDRVVDTLCKVINKDPAKVRLCVRSYLSSHVPKPGAKLSELLAFEADRVYYEVFDIPVAQLSKKKIVKVRWHGPDTQQQEHFTLYLDEHAAFSDLLSQLKLRKPLPDTSDHRLLDIFDSRITKEARNVKLAMARAI
eukprot:TRINITY_DN4786_c0_g1_i6.p1 TRINITY_DN4786_c0_g1~~TRINITY_DN4786_c0_g1_i6.p1  ORF type:complete len:975 (-),score=258.77 TRINITY_DN4786_c0_g1_i6:133-3057(-)